MKKISLIILIAVIAVIFCGCGEAIVRCTIDDQNTATMAISFSIEASEITDDEIEEIYQSIDDLEKHLISKGYSVNTNDTDQKLKIKITKSIQGTSPEDALNKLLDMMGDDSSPFSSVEGGYSESSLNDLYNINAVVDLTKIVDYNYISTMKQNQQDRISELMSTFSGTVTLDLHGKTVEYKGVLDGTANTVELSLNEPTEIYSMVEVEHKENMAEYEGLKAEVTNIISEKSKYMTMVFICAGVLIASAIAIIIIMILRKGKKSKQAEVKADLDNNETKIIKNNEDQDDSSGKD